MKADAAGSAHLCRDSPLSGSRFKWARLNPTACAGNVGLDEDTGRYFSQSTSLTLVQMINPEIVEQHAGNHARAGTNLNAYRYRSPIAAPRSNELFRDALAGSGQVGLVTASAHTLNSSPSPRPSRRGVPDANAAW